MIVYTLSLSFSLNLSYGVKPNKAACGLLPYREARALGSLALHPSHPLPGILYLSNTRVSVFPQVDEFLVMFYGFGLPVFLLEKSYSLFDIAQRAKCAELFRSQRGVL